MGETLSNGVDHFDGLNMMLANMVKETILPSALANATLLIASPDVDMDNKQSLVRLEHLSAVAIAKDGRNHQILAQTLQGSHCKIRKIDISGYGKFEHKIIDMIEIKEPKPCHRNSIAITLFSRILCILYAKE